MESQRKDMLRVHDKGHATTHLLTNQLFKQHVTEQKVVPLEYVFFMDFAD